MAQREPKFRRGMFPAQGQQAAAPILAEAPKEDISTTRKVLAGLLRGGTGLGGSLFSGMTLGTGSIPAAVIGYTGDLGAQMIEEGDPNPFNQLDPQSQARAFLEGSLTAIPGGWLMKGGKAFKSAQRSGLVAGGGEALREKLRGEDIDPFSVGLSTVVGGGLGALFSKFLPSKPGFGEPDVIPTPAVARTIDDLAGQPDLDVDTFVKELPEIMTKGGWKTNLDRILSEATKLDEAGRTDLGQALRETGISTGYWDPKVIALEIDKLVGQGKPLEAQALRLAALKTRKHTTRVALDADKFRLAEEKAALRQKRLDLAKQKEEEAILAGGQRKTSVSTGVSEVDPITGETISAKTAIVPKEGQGGSARSARPAGDNPVGPMSPDGVPGQWTVIDADTGDIIQRFNTIEDVDNFMNNPGRLSLADAGMTPRLDVIPPSDWAPPGVPKAPTGPEQPPSPTGASVPEPTTAPVSGVNKAVAPILAEPPVPVVPDAPQTGLPVEAPQVADDVLPVDEIPVELPQTAPAQPETPLATTSPAAPIVDLSPVTRDTSGMGNKDLLKYYKSVSPVEDIKFLLRTVTDIPEELKAKATAILVSGKATRQNAADLFNEVKAWSAARQKLAGEPAIGSPAWHDALNGAPKVDVSPSIPEVPQIPVVEGPPVGLQPDAPMVPPSTEPPVAPVEPPSADPVVTEPPVQGPPTNVAPGASKETETTARILLDRSLRDLNYSPDDISKMSLEEAQQIVANRVMAPSGKVPQASQKRGGGGIKIDDTLSAKEKSDIAAGVLKESYPSELADALIPLGQRYQELKEQIAAAGKPTKGTPADNALKALKNQWSILGMQMKTLTLQAEESGIIPPGFGSEISQRISMAIEDANAAKFASKIPIKSPEAFDPSKLDDVFEGELPTIGSEVGLVDDIPEVDVTALPKMTPDGPGAQFDPAVGEDPLSGAVNLPEDLAQKLTALRQGVIDGTTDPAEADRIGQEIQAAIIELQKNSSGGIGAVFGAFEGLRNNPQLALRAALIAGGALAGGAVDPLDDPILSMALGAGLGIGAGKLAGSLRQFGINSAQATQAINAGGTEEAKWTSSAIYHLLPHVQRANYLWSAYGIPANAWVGPYGSAFFGALTKGLAGDPRGWAALKGLTPGKWTNHYIDSWTEAKELIKNVERGSPVSGEEFQANIINKMLGGTDRASQVARGYIQGPAYMMASGDLASRKILMEAGFSEKEAMEITLTSEPWLPGFKKIMNFRRGTPSPMLELAAPFVRTPLNILEQGMMRVPYFGFKVHKALEKAGRPADPFREQIAQQGMGFLIGTAAYAIGLATPPEQAKYIRRFVSNAGGQYSGIAAIGFAMGQGSRRTSGGPIEGAASPEALRQFGYSFPLPSADVFTDKYSYVSNLYNGKPASVPPGVLPLVYKEITDGAADDLPRRLTPSMAPIMSGPKFRR